ncbi:DUF4347 domain-containing protein [Aphanizomenon sp. UHCC 0183]|uniref:DUF4347 domain-containing protein n=1 Tax=Aphanizomenon sp. UHCC 0183 TaxID=2590028 RepID=UPI001445E8D2|nr:DUF4347 domain-containing protein [Aphanizomenon sp. UHCC 0183]MTJ31398.1 DUF4347 domain-containing protein [Aphanizomenon sp. UHCC 0183]
MSINDITNLNSYNSDPLQPLNSELEDSLYQKPYKSSSLPNYGLDTLVFVDSLVQDYGQILSNLSSSVGVVVLDSHFDGIGQIGEILSNYTNINTIHIFSHGDAGSTQLGNTNLNNGNLQDYRNQLMGWGNALTEQGDILFYGCNIAHGTLGESFVNQIAQLTGADVAASDDLTGNTTFGGDDWVLEYQTGNIEATVWQADQSFSDVLGSGTVSLSAGKLTFQDIDSANQANQIELSSDGTNLIISDSSALMATGTGTTVSNGNVTVALADITDIKFDLGLEKDTLTFTSDISFSNGRLNSFIIEGLVGDTINFNHNLYLGGGDLNVSVEAINVANGVTISTRQVAANANHLTANSTGDSGELYFIGINPINITAALGNIQSVREINIGNEAKLLSHVENNSEFSAADLWLNARYFSNATIDNLFPVTLPDDWSPKTATISIGDNANLKGNNIIIKAQAEDKNFTELIGADSLLDNFVIAPLQSRMEEALALPVKVLVRKSKASVTVNTGVVLDGLAGVSVEAVANTISSGQAAGSLISIGFAYADAEATVDLRGNAQIKAGEAVRIGSEGNATASITSKIEGKEGSTSPGLAFAVDYTNIKSHATVSQDVVITAGKSVNVIALGNNSTESNAESKTGNTSPASFGFGITISDTDINATVNGTITANQNTGAIVKLELDPTRSVTYEFDPTKSTLNAGNDSLTLSGVSHALRTGDKITYNAKGGQGFGLMDNGTYYVWVDPTNSNVLKFTTNRSDAINSRNFVDLDNGNSAALGTQNFTAAGVDNANNTLTLSGSDVFNIGRAVVYDSAGEAIGGLTDGKTYYVITYGDNGSGKQVIQLAATESDARQGIAINLTSAGTSHTLSAYHQFTTPIVDVDANTIDLAKVYGINDSSITPHALATGDQVGYANRRGTSIGGVETQFQAGTGLVDGSDYFIVTDPNNANVIRLASSELKALEAYGKLEDNPEADLTGLVIKFDDGAAVNSKSFNPTQLGIVDDSSNQIILDNKAFQGDDFFGNDANFSLVGSTFELGQAVIYNSNGGRPIGGLQDGKVYYVVTATSENNLDGDNRFVTKQTIQLTDSENKARAGIALDIDPTLATGSNHSLTATHVLDSGLATGIGVLAHLSSSDAAIATSEMNDKPKAGSADVSLDAIGGVTGLVGKVFDKLVNGKKNGDAANKTEAGGNNDKSSLSIAGALAFAHTNHDVQANVGSTAVLKSGEDLEVKAEIEEEMKLNADSDVVGGATSSGSAAVVVGIYNNNADATVHGGARLDADRATRVIAGVKYPYLTRPDEFIPMNLGELVDLVKTDGYGAVNDYLDGTLGLKSKLLNTWSRSTASGENIGISGSVNLLIFNNDADAIVKSGALINQDNGWRTRKVDLQDQSVSVEATNYMQLLNLTGVFKFSLPTLEADLGKVDLSKADIKLLGADGKSGIGGAFALMFLDNRTQALVETGSSIWSGSRGGFNMKAEEAIMNFNFTQAGAKATESYGISGTFAYVNQDSTTVARLAGGTTVAGNDVTIYAGSLDTHINWAGGVAVGQSLGFGATVGINDINRNTYAIIGNIDPFADNFDPLSLTNYPSPSENTNINITGTLKVDAKSDGWLGAFSVAAAVADGTPNPPKTTKTGSTGRRNAISVQPTSAIGISGNVSYNKVNDHVQSIVHDAGILQAVSVDLAALNETDLYAIGGSVAFVKSGRGKNSAGIAGAAGWNEVGGTAKAYIYGQGANKKLTLNAEQLNVNAKSNGNIIAIVAGGSGAVGNGGQTNVSLAGSFSYNQINNDTASFVQGVNANLTSSKNILPVLVSTSDQIQTYQTKLNTISFANSLGWTTGTAVKYDNGGNTSLGGLNTTDTYYVVVDPINSKIMKLSTDVAGNNIVDINSDSATGTGHRLYLASTPVSQDTITFAEDHGFNNNDQITYSSGDGNDIGGLEGGKTYYVIKVNEKTIKLALNSGDSNAISLDLTKATGDSHSLKKTALDGFSYNLEEFDPVDDRAFELSQVEVKENLILSREHEFETGQALVYDNGGGKSIGGLTNGKTYYAIADAGNPKVLRVANSETEAKLGFAIALDPTQMTGDNHQFFPETHVIKAEDTSKIFSIAGTASVSLGSTKGGGGFGFGFAWNDIQSNTQAWLKDSTFEYEDSLQVIARNDSTIQTVSASIGVSQAQQTAAMIAGTASVNLVDNITKASVINSNLGKSDNYAGLTRLLTDDSATIQALSGAISVTISKSGSSLGFGAAVAYNAIGTGSATGHQAIADITGSTLYVDSLDISAGSNQLIQSIAATAAVAVSGKAAISGAGAVTINDIEKINTQSFITGSTVNVAKDIQVLADNKSEINSIAGQVAVSVSKSSSSGAGAIGAAVSVNQINPLDVHAYIDNSVVTSTNGSLTINAESQATIETLAFGVQVGVSTGSFAGSIGGSVAVNEISGSVKAYIANSTNTTVKNAVTITAKDEATIRSLAGQAAVTISKSSGAGAIGAAVSVNQINPVDVHAYIDNSVVTSTNGSLTINASG